MSDTTTTVPQSAEQWRPVFGYEDRYEVSDLGRIRTLLHRHTGSIVKPHPRRRDGYLVVQFFIAAHKRNMTPVHRVVALTFLGPRPPGAQINHKNGIKPDNRVANLEYLTVADHLQHTIRMGLYPRGETHRHSKLNEAMALVILGKLLDGGQSHAALAVSYGVSGVTIDRVANGVHWTTKFPAVALLVERFQRLRAEGAFAVAPAYCRRGHALSDANAYAPTDGRRRCQTCKRERRLALHTSRANRDAHVRDEHGVAR